ncbi:hypothetical protein AAVH_06699 [Aphelenchoides avenae]|nr:hypothetical protein AAVH_06699 [Aphelenchus avenae]
MSCARVNHSSRINQNIDSSWVQFKTPVEARKNYADATFSREPIRGQLNYSSSVAEFQPHIRGHNAYSHPEAQHFYRDHDYASRLYKDHDWGLNDFYGYSLYSNLTCPLYQKQLPTNRFHYSTDYPFITTRDYSGNKHEKFYNWYNQYPSHYHNFHRKPVHHGHYRNYSAYSY